MNKPLTWIGDVTGGTVFNDTKTRVDHVAIDTRISFAPNSMFVAIRGPRFDGHSFVERALEKGAVAALTEEPVDGIPYVLVDDTVDALQKLAATWRAEVDPIVVGITGSNGKTIIKDMLADMLSRHATTHRSPGSYNSQVGVALTLLGLERAHEFAVIEAGISKVGEMERLATMIRPNIVVWSNVGDAHSAGLGGGAGIAREKAKLMDGEARNEHHIIFPSDEPLIAQEVEKRTWSKSSVETFNVAEQSDLGFSFEMNTLPDTTLSISVPGRHNVTNAALAATAAAHLGVSTDDIKIALAAHETADLRLQLHTTSGGVTLINDTYNSDPTSARFALNALTHYGIGHRKIAVLGDMLDLGEISETAHENLGKLVAQSDIEHVVAIGTFAKSLANGARQGGMAEAAIDEFATLDDAEERIRLLVNPGDYLLVKGSRAMQLDRVAERFLDSVAPARLEIDLDVIADNIGEIRRAASPAKVMAVVKSFAYGNDSTRVSQTLAQQGVEYFAVAYPDEAIPLRRRGIDLPILVTNVFAEEADKIARYRLDALVSREPLLEELERVTTPSQPVGVHLEIETGMNRLGIPLERVASFATRIAASDRLQLHGVMTHFAAADDPSEDAFTREQIEKFERALDTIRTVGIDGGIESVILHAANTAATWRFPEAAFDMVRVGIGIYGIHPSEAVGESATTRPALRFSTRVIDVRDVGAKESVGYGRTWRATRDSKIATIAVDYNDGFPRFMSNGGEVLIRGVRCKVVGNVCMDACMVDVTGIDAEPGDEVVLFGRQGRASIPIAEIAAQGATIPYEILTQISPRVRRIFQRG